MKRFLLLLLSIILLSINIKSEEVSPDWTTFDIDKYLSMYWLDSNRSVVIELIGSYHNASTMGDFELHFFDLSTHKLIKKVPTNTYFIPPSMELNSDKSLFYYIFRDTLFTYSKNEYLLQNKISLPFNYKQITDFRYNYASKKYTLFSKRENELILVSYDSDNYEILKYDTIPINSNYYNIKISKNGKYLLLKSSKTEISVYETENAKLLKTIHTDLSINQAEISENGDWLSIFTNYISDNNYEFYNLKDESKDFQITNNYFGIPYHIKFSENGKYFLISYDSYLFLYETSTKELKRQFSPPNAYRSADFCLNDTKIIFVSSSRVLLANNINLKEIYTLSDFDKFGKILNLNGLTFNDNSEKFYVYGNEGRISLRNTNTGEIEDEYKFDCNSLYILNKSIKDTLITFSYTNFNLNYVDTRSKNILNSIDLNGVVRFYGIVSNDLQWYGSTITYNNFILLNLDRFQKDKEKFTIDAGNVITYIAFSDNSKMFAVGTKGNIIKIYYIDDFSETIKLKYTLTYPEEIPTGSISFIKFIDNDSKIVSSSNSTSKFLVWDIEYEEIIHTPILPVEVSPKQDFPSIKYIAYRERFNDYFTIDSWGNILFWDKNFNFTHYLYIGKSFNYDIANSFDYSNMTNNLLIACNYTTIVKLNLDFISSIESSDISKHNIQIYPNPTSDYINISFDNSLIYSPTASNDEQNNYIKIYDVLGIEVLRESINNFSVSYRINIENLSTGMYFIKIGNNIEKFIKK